MKGGLVPFLLTIDSHGRTDLQDELGACLDELARVGMVATFFIPGYLAGRPALRSTLRRLLREGHDIGSHGLLHSSPEDFGMDPIDVQVSYLQEAKDRIEDAAGVSVTAFRAPGFIISATTLRALEQCGYRADLSVNAGRLSLISSQVGNVRWLTAPRCPYHPRHDNPYARGRMALWEIPQTSLVFPFTSTLYHVLGLTFARAFAAVLIKEAALARDRPVVFMAHPEEFYPSRRIRPAMYCFGKTAASLGFMRWRLFVPHRNSGFRFRWLLYETSEYKMFLNTMGLIKFLSEQRALTPMTVNQYLARLDAAGVGQLAPPPGGPSGPSRLTTLLSGALQRVRSN